MSAHQLRNAMADRLRSWGGEPIPPQISAAIRAVPREAFLPGTSLTEAYGSSPVVTHRDANGVATSSASAPGIVAAMLTQLDVHPGHRILEIGAGTGYNAALLAHITGPAGQVTTVELDPGTADEARKALTATGYRHVNVVTGDGEYGYIPNAPYDRIIVTAGAWELSAAWAHQLAPGGLLVVPLRMRGLTRSLTFGYADGTWRSQAMFECGFMPIRGIGGVAETNIRLGNTGVTIRIDDGQTGGSPALQNALSTGPTQTWTGIDGTGADQLDFWIAGTPGFFRLLAGPSAVESSGIVAPAFNWGAMGLFTTDSFAYLTERPTQPGHSELGVCGYGPGREHLVGVYADRIRAFDRDRATATSLQVEVHPLTDPPSADALMHIEKRSSRVLIRTEPSLPV